MFKFNSKTKPITITLLILSICSGMISVIFFKNSYDESKVRTILESSFLGKITTIGNYSNIEFFNKTERRIVQTKFDLFKPVYTYIVSYGFASQPPKSFDDNKQFDVLVFYLERNNNLDWKVSSSNKQTVYSTDSKKLTESSKTKDLSTVDQYNGQTISHFQNLTPTQIQEAQKQAQSDKEFEDTQKNSPKLTPAEFYIECKKDVQDYKGLIEAKNKGDEYYTDHYGNKNPTNKVNVYNMNLLMIEADKQCEIGKQ